MQALINNLRERLSRITYKPNVTLGLQEEFNSAGGCVRLGIDFRVQDTNDPTKTVNVRHTCIAPMKMIEDNFEQWVFQRIVLAENHEAAEWFRVDGVMVNNPHAHEPNGRNLG